MVSDPFPPETGNFRAFWEHVTNDVVENTLEVGSGASRQRCKDDRFYDALAKPVPNLEHYRPRLPNYN